MVITFFGKYGSGADKFAQQIKLPNPINELSQVHGWPDSLVPGTFNIDVDQTRWPRIDGLDFESLGLKCLDRNDLFRPIAYLDYGVVPNNTLSPENNGEFAGDFQFWKSVMRIEDVDQSFPCYLLRRVRSAYQTKIEVVSNTHYESTYQLEHGRKVQLTVYGNSPYQVR